MMINRLGGQPVFGNEQKKKIDTPKKTKTVTVPGEAPKPAEDLPVSVPKHKPEEKTIPAADPKRKYRTCFA